MNQQSQYAAFLLRISLGVVLVAHSLYLKLTVFTLAGTAQFFSSIGLPSALAYGVFAVEAIAGIALILGFHSRIAAVAVIPVLIGATWAHWPAGWLFTNANGGWEYPLYLTVTAAAVALLGDGKFALSTALKGEKGRDVVLQAN